MPEGDTVWRAARRLREALEGHELTRTDFRVPQHATLDLSGQVVDEVLSRGKHLLVRVGDHSVHTHLKMEGVWHVHPHGTAWRRPDHMARLVLETSTQQAVGFSLGITDVLPRSDDGLDFLGPDLLGPDWDLDEAVRRITHDPQVPVFVALHQQRNVAGFGNEYVNEICFLSGVLPTRPVAEADARRMVERGQRMIMVNRDRPERVFTGNSRSGMRHWVFGRGGRPCRRCGTKVARGQLGESPTRLRNTFWCPNCQT